MVDSGFMPGSRCLPMRTNKQPLPSTSSFITIQAKAEPLGTLLKISLRILQNSTDLSVGSGAHLDHGHHAKIFVVKDVTMVDGPAREILKRDSHAHTSAHGHIDGVFPSLEGRAFTILIQHLKRVGVNVEGVIERHHHAASVDDLPLLDGPEFDDGISPFRVERSAVDRKGHTLPVH